MNIILRIARFAGLLVLVSLASWTLLDAIGQPIVGVDDANILFVYSKHLAAGEGLVYNIGGERVEGFSSLLWMLIVAVGFLLTDRPEPILLALNIIFVSTAAFAGVQFIETRFNRGLDASAGRSRFISLASLVFIAWVVAAPAYLLWTVTSLMETGLWSLLLIFATLQILRIVDDGNLDQRRVVNFSLLLILLLMTRPEAMAWVVHFVLLYCAVLRWLGFSGREFWRRLIPPVTASLACLAVLTAFRLAYFGFPLPNTYYAKMAPDAVYNIGQGLQYLIQFLINSGLAAAFVAASIAGVFFYLRRVLVSVFGAGSAPSRDACSVFVISATVLSGLAIAVLMGGDIFGAYRFIQPIWPLLILVGLSWMLVAKPDFCISFAASARPLTVAVITLVGFLAFSSSTSFRWFNLASDRERVFHLFELAQRGRVLGAYLHELFEDPGSNLPSLGVSAAGGVKMGYRGPVIDLMGLNFTPMAHHHGDRRGITAHAAFEKDIFWEYRPDFVEPRLCPESKLINTYTDPDNWNYRILGGLPVDERFRESFQFVAIQAPVSRGWLCTYIYNELLDQVAAGSDVDVRRIE